MSFPATARGQLSKMAKAMVMTKAQKCKDSGMNIFRENCTGKFYSSFMTSKTEHRGIEL